MNFEQAKYSQSIVSCSTGDISLRDFYIGNDFVLEFYASLKLLNLQALEGENKVAKIKRTNNRLLGEYKFHNYIEEQQIR